MSKNKQLQRSLFITGTRLGQNQVWWFNHGSQSSGDRSDSTRFNQTRKRRCIYSTRKVSIGTAKSLRGGKNERYTIMLFYRLIFGPKLKHFIEIKQWMLKMGILEQVFKRKSTGCMIQELDSLDCRKGCVTCHLSEKMEAINLNFPNKEEGPGDNIHKIKDASLRV